MYRLDGETILKVVKDMTLDAIHSEVKVSKDVLICGIPTAISYDVAHGGRIRRGFRRHVPLREKDELTLIIALKKDPAAEDVAEYVKAHWD